MIKYFADRPFLGFLALPPYRDPIAATRLLCVKLCHETSQLLPEALRSLYLYIYFVLVKCSLRCRLYIIAQ